MSLDTKRLEAVRPLAGGGLQARCPACAEHGADTAGEHLRVRPDGRFGCCVHPKDRERRKRIFALAGTAGLRKFTVRVAVTKESATASVAGVLRGTFGKGAAEPVRGEGCMEAAATLEAGTSGTPFSRPRTHRKNEMEAHMCKDVAGTVPCVPEDRDRKGGDEAGPIAEPQPHLSPSGLLVIPFGSNPRFHWWKDGQDPEVTRAEVLERLRRAGNGDMEKEVDDARV